MLARMQLSAQIVQLVVDDVTMWLMNPIIHLLTQTRASCSCVLPFKWHFASPDGACTQVKCSLRCVRYSVFAGCLCTHCNQLLGTAKPHANSDYICHTNLPSSSSIITWVIAVCNVQMGLEPWNECTETWLWCKVWDIVWDVISGACNMWNTVCSNLIWGYSIV